MGERQKTVIRKLKKLRAEKFLAFSCDGSCAGRQKKKLIPKIIALGVGPPVLPLSAHERAGRGPERAGGAHERAGRGPDACFGRARGQVQDERERFLPTVPA